MTTTMKLAAQHDCASCIKAQGSPLVLGAGGWNIFHHFGVLRALAENNIAVDRVLGASAGSMTAAFVTNGYEPEDIAPVFLEMLGARDNPLTLLRALKLGDPMSMMVGGPISLEPFIRETVEKYNLKPNKHLTILACDFLTHQPVLFTGEHYDLVTALTASCSVPGVFQPVWHMRDGRPMLLVDGAVYHYNTTEFFDEPCIVSKFRPATEPPTEWKYPIDLYYHFREIYLPLAGNQRYVDAKRNLVIETGTPNVAGLNFGISKETCLKMIETGYNTANQVIAEARKAGRFCENTCNSCSHGGSAQS